MMHRKIVSEKGGERRASERKMSESKPASNKAAKSKKKALVKAMHVPAPSPLNKERRGTVHNLHWNIPVQFAAIQVKILTLSGSGLNY